MLSRLFNEDFDTLSVTEQIVSALVGAALATVLAMTAGALLFAGSVALLT